MFLTDKKVLCKFMQDVSLTQQQLVEAFVFFFLAFLSNVIVKEICSHSRVVVRRPCVCQSSRILHYAFHNAQSNLFAVCASEIVYAYSLICLY